MIHTDFITNSEDIKQKINFIMELADKRKTNKAYGILIKGYVFQHEERCEKQDCSLKIVKKLMQEEHNINSTRNLEVGNIANEVRDVNVGHIGHLSENREANITTLLFSYCNQIYENAIHK